ncbi:hypothetical protein ABZ469_14165 [Microbacterium oleivorans]|uniref:hypothetical protein n=1 Tax=Microbacterium oleivorans TaxID=273677 RepID=UPI0033D1A6DF
MSTDTPSPFRSRGFIVAAAVVGLIAMIAVVALIAGLLNGDDDATPPTPTSTPAESTTPVGDDDPSVCGLTAVEDSSSLTAAPTNTWELVGTMAAPTETEVGPGAVDDSLRSCFARTAEGALFAAVNFVATGTDANLGPRLIDLVAPGPGRDALEAQDSAGSSSSLRAQVAGFKVAAYSATIDLALNYSDGSLVSVPLKLQWVEGDWKVEMTTSGDLPLAPAGLQNLGGYIPWSGA